MLTVNYPHITKLKNSAACLERFPRTRVAQIAMDYLAYGWSVEEICRQFILQIELNQEDCYGH